MKKLIDTLVSLIYDAADRCFKTAYMGDIEITFEENEVCVYNYRSGELMPNLTERVRKIALIDELNELFECPMRIYPD